MIALDRPQLARWAILVLLVASVIFRLAACRGDLWLDEIWTIEMAQQAESPLAIFTALHHDNNHYLNTLLMQTLGDRLPVPIYRLAALMATILWLLWLVRSPWRRGYPETILVLLLVGISYRFVLKTTEARGYGFLLLFVGLAWSCLWREINNGKGPWALLFGVSSILGFLSHLSFLFFFAGAFALLLASADRLAARRGGVGGAVWRLFGLPVAFLVLLYWVDIRHLSVGGAPPMSALGALGRATALALGLPTLRLFVLLAPVALGLAIAVEIVRMRREAEPEWALFTVAIFVAPPLILALTRPPFVTVRYFLVPTFLALLVLAALLRRGWVSGGWRRAVTVAVMVGIVLGNLSHLYSFLHDLRGEYTQALDLIAAESSTSSVSVASDHDHRNRVVLEFYARRGHPQLDLDYVEVDRWQAEKPAWLVLHSLTAGQEARAELQTVGGTYSLVATYRHYGLSGWDWFVYRRSLKP